MIITNKLGLPHAVVRAAQNDGYSKDGADFTSTQLANPPRAEALKVMSPGKLQIDAASRLASMLGGAIHDILQRSARPEIDIVEKRFFAEYLGYKLGGKIDLYQSDDQILYEYKSCLANAFGGKNGGGKKFDWIAQASVNKLLMELNGVTVKKVIIVGWLVDWRNWNLSDPNYPRTPVVPVEIEAWPKDKTEIYIEERIKLHAAALNNLPMCTSKETWGGKMCQSYCEASMICDQYQKSKKTGLLESGSI